MASLTGWLRAGVLARCFAMQGAWNYSSMLGSGMAFALIPILRRVYAGRPDELAGAVARHASYFNAHPYLASVAVGALARLESEGAEREEIERFRRALVSPLGTLGDRLVWARWRPLCSVLAVLLALLLVEWWIVLSVFLVVYNAFHVRLREWGLDLGWRQGREVASALHASTLRRLPERLTIPIAAISGITLPPLVLRFSWARPSGTALYLIIAAAGLAGLAYWKPAIGGRASSYILVAATLILAVLGTLS